MKPALKAPTRIFFAAFLSQWGRRERRSEPLRNPKRREAGESEPQMNAKNAKNAENADVTHSASPKIPQRATNNSIV